VRLGKAGHGKDAERRKNNNLEGYIMAKAKGEANKIELIEVPETKREIFALTIIGDTSLLCNKFSDRQKGKILDKQTKKAKVREAKNPVIDFIESMYWLTKKPEMNYDTDCEEAEKTFMKAVEDGAKFGFPSTGIKKAAATAGYRAGLTKDIVTALGFFHIRDGMIEIQNSTPKINESVTRIPSTGGADIRYRGEFENWKMTFEVICSKDIFPKEKVINLINLAGFSVGIGDWRPEKKGSHGTFHIQTNKED
jgi:hypothetical protein